MPIPNLLHPVDVILEQINKASTFYDEDAREPVQAAARVAQVTVPGQAKLVASMEFSPYKAGPEEGESGYVLFRYVDLAAQSLTLNRGDRIVKIGNETFDAYITRLRPEGHYADQGGATLVKAWFADRQPARQ